MGTNRKMDCTPYTPAQQIEGLTVGALLHRSRHADTVLANWHGLEVVAKCVRADIDEEEFGHVAANGILREGLLLRRLEHPSIVRVVELTHQPAALILERVPGRSLREELRIRRRLPAIETARIGVQLASALSYLHRRWILHRDMKPANVIYDGYRAVLIDFHLAKEPGAMRGGAGTRLFTAPEQVRGGHVTSAADIWGLGTILYRAVTGRLPFHAESGHPQLTVRSIPTLDRLANTRFGGNLDRAKNDLPLELARLIDRMLLHDPDLRPTAEDVEATLAGMADDSPLMVEQ